jgi:type IV pilus assembly protein PilC
MPSYYYRARDMEGRPHEGVEVAASEEEVLRFLENSRLIPVKIESREPGGVASIRGQFESDIRSAVHQWRTSVKPVSIALFARQLSTMTSAGLPLVKSLRSIARDHEDKRLGTLLERVAEDVQRGESLATALGRYPGAFDEVFVSLVHTGEVSGTLDTILDQTAGYMERSETLRLKVQAALRYPMFVLSIAMAMLMTMVIFVIPKFSGIYSQFKVPLPLPTRVLLGVSNTIVNNLPIALLLLVLVAGTLWYYLRREQGRMLMDRAKLAMPMFGPLIRLYAVTKFSRTLGILTGSGTQILSALKVMRPVPGNRVIERGIEQVRARVEEGDSLARALGDTKVFPEMLVQMAATGEETGQLDRMLSRTADYYEQRVTSQVDGLSSLIEPFAVLILGGIVGFMLLALYLPIFNMGQAMRSGLMGQ